jgi:hypothetical protein
MEGFTWCVDREEVVWKFLLSFAFLVCSVLQPHDEEISKARADDAMVFSFLLL